MRVHCSVQYVDMDAAHGVMPGVIVTCNRCGHETHSYGQQEGSLRRCFALLSEQCPEDESNFYTEEE
jgi:hypothetical protein